MRKVCLKCGKPLVYKKGVSKTTKEPYEMMSCSGYPECKYAENAPGTVELLQDILDVLENIDINIANKEIKD